MDQEIWTIEQLGTYLHLSRSQVYSLTRKRYEARHEKNRLPRLNINGNIRFRKVDILAWLDRLAQEDQ
jgi:predicted DNA-binding transcriptional regulator AlpA